MLPQAGHPPPRLPTKSCSRRKSQNGVWGCGEEDQVREVREAGSVDSPGKRMLSWSQEFTEVKARERLRRDLGLWSHKDLSLNGSFATVILGN